jgi:periplasmic protein CpxP/Spy
MKKTSIVLILGVFMIASATCFHAFGTPAGPPSGPSSPGGGFMGGPPGPPPHGPGFFGGPPGPPPHAPGFLGMLAGPPDLIEKLKLTDDQLKQMRQVSVDFQNKTRKARTALMGLHDEKSTMLMSGKIDQAKLAKLDEETTQLAAEVMGEELKVKREHLAKLTPEQLDQLRDAFGKGPMGHGPKMMGR